MQTSDVILSNPLSEDALTLPEIIPGVRFIWQRPGDSLSVRHGTFLSEPYYDNFGDMVVKIQLDGERVRSSELYMLGILPSREGEWQDTFAVREAEG